MTRLFRVAPLAAVPLLAVGCIAPVGSPYGPPSGFVPQGGVTPYGNYGGPYVQPGAVIGPGGGTVVPPGQGATFGGPTYAPPQGGSSAPSFRPSAGFDRPPADPPSVPEYTDPNGFGGGGFGDDAVDFGGGGFDADFGGSSGGSGSVPPAGGDDFGAPPAAGDFGTQPGGDDFGFAPSDDFGAVTPRSASARPGPLVARMPTDSVRTAGYDTPAPAATAEPARIGGDGLFGRTSDYRRLRGKIDYDPQLNNWNVIYDVAPELADEYGGSFTLHDPEGALSRFRSEDIVALEGFPDRASGVDVLGKPLYRVKQAELIALPQ